MKTNTFYFGKKIDFIQVKKLFFMNFSNLEKPLFENTIIEN